MNDDVRVFGYCAECGNIITDECEDIYVDSDGNYFDSIDCLIDYFDVVRLEL